MKTYKTREERMITRLAIACGCLAICMLVGIMGAITPSIGPNVVSGTLPVSQQGYTSFTTGSLTFTSSAGGTIANLSESAGTWVLTGSGLVTSVAASGSYAIPSGGTSNYVTPALVNGQPVYLQSGGTLDLWYALPIGQWVISGSNTVGGLIGSGTPANYLVGSGIAGQALNNQQFLTGGGSITTYSGTGALTVSSTTSALVSSGVSAPCSGLVLVCTTTGVLVGSSSNGGGIPLPANVPMQMPLGNLNELWVTAGSLNNVGYGYYK